MRKGLGKSGSRHDFKKDVGHSGLRHARLDGGAKCSKALGFIKLVEGRDHNPHLVGDRLKTQVRIVAGARSEEHTSELQSLMRISYAVFCLKKHNITAKEREGYVEKT